MSGFYSGVGRGPHRGRGFGTAACAAVNLICVCHWAKCSILALMWYNNSIHGCSGVLNTVNHSVTECKCKEKWEKITSLKKQSQTQDEGERRWRTGTEPDWDVWVELSLLALTAAQRSQTFPLILWWNVASSFGRYSEPKSSINANRLVWTPQGPSSQQGTQPPLLYRGGARGQVHKGVMGMWRSRGRSIMSPIECKSNSRDTLCPMLWCNHYVSVGEWQVRYSTSEFYITLCTHTHIWNYQVCVVSSCSRPLIRLKVLTNEADSRGVKRPLIVSVGVISTLSFTWCSALFCSGAAAQHGASQQIAISGFPAGKPWIRPNQMCHSHSVGLISLSSQAALHHSWLHVTHGFTTPRMLSSNMEWMECVSVCVSEEWSEEDLIQG